MVVTQIREPNVLDQDIKSFLKTTLDCRDILKNLPPM